MMKELEGLNVYMMSLTVGFKSLVEKESGKEVSLADARKAVENMSVEERKMLEQDMRVEQDKGL